MLSLDAELVGFGCDMELGEVQLGVGMRVYSRLGVIGRKE